MNNEEITNQEKINDEPKPSDTKNWQLKAMNEREIKRALTEAARQNMLEILEEEMYMENILSDLPESAMIASILKKQLVSR